MDEIIIEEKKYISSKQASKITGYAKDYIGQLCREGRVPARLVGRSWYVLESAIQDHRFGRFGNQEVDMGTVTPEPVKPVPAERDWGSFHYEAQTDEVVPSVYGEHVESVNQLQERNSLGLIDHEDSKIEPIAKEISQSLQDAWGEWFNAKIAPQSAAAPAIAETRATDSEPEVYEEAEAEEDAQPEGESVAIPLTIVNYQQVLEKESLPTLQKYEKQPEPMPRESARKEGSSRAARLIRGFACTLAIVSVVLAVSGSGFLDKYLASSSVVQILSGSIVYEK